MRLKKIIIRILRRINEELRLFWWNFLGKFRETITFSCRHGVFTGSLKGDDHISKRLYTHGQCELDFIVQTMEFLRSIQKCPTRGKGTVLDVGANNGVVSIGMLYNGELERAIAIEPEPWNFLFLQRNVKQNGLSDRIICLPYAVSDHDGEIQLEVSDLLGDHRVRMNVHGHDATELFQETERRVITVRSSSLDSLLANLPVSHTQDISLMWIDVQGHEGYVFSGARNLLSKDIPVVSEIWPYGIRRSGMSQESFCNIASSIWSNYWVLRKYEVVQYPKSSLEKNKFVRYPINTLDILFDELGYDGDFVNVIFTR